MAECYNHNPACLATAQAQAVHNYNQTRANGSNFLVKTLVCRSRVSSRSRTRDPARQPQLLLLLVRSASAAKKAHQHAMTAKTQAAVHRIPQVLLLAVTQVMSQDQISRKQQQECHLPGRQRSPARLARKAKLDGRSWTANMIQMMRSPYTFSLKSRSRRLLPC